MNDLQSFLEKVTSGTATSSDLSSMESELHGVQTAGSTTVSYTSTSSNTGSSSTSTGSTTGTGNIDNDLQAFLAKVANGSATSSDLSSMQSELQQMFQGPASDSTVNPL
jgi:hypothetical protein